jgi:hypothetical protein
MAAGRHAGRLLQGRWGVSAVEPGHILEDALASIEGAVALLTELGETRNDGVLTYIAHRLADHHDQAEKAFQRVRAEEIRRTGGE